MVGFLINYLQVFNQSCNSCIWVGRFICLSMCVDFTSNMSILLPNQLNIEVIESVLFVCHMRAISVNFETPVTGLLGKRIALQDAAQDAQ